MLLYKQVYMKSTVAKVYFSERRPITEFKILTTNNQQIKICTNIHQFKSVLLQILSQLWMNSASMAQCCVPKCNSESFQTGCYFDLMLWLFFTP